MADKRGRILEHRYVMSEYLGRPLAKTEIVHHENENKLDNRAENLELTNNSDHGKHHHPADIRKLVCEFCGREFERAARNIKNKLQFCGRSCSASYYAPAKLATGNKPTHGEYGCYRKGCRCEKCKLANARRIAAYRNDKRALA